MSTARMPAQPIPKRQASPGDNNSGCLTGNGRLDLSGTFTNPVGGEIRQNPRDWLEINAANALNQGDIRLLGSALVAMFGIARRPHAG